MKIVILDGFTSNPGDLSWDDIKSLGDTTVWPRTSTGDFSQRAKNADVLVVNKFILGENEFKQVPRLKLVCTLATGYNNVDIDYCNAHGITVCNAVGYSSQSVAQHVFAMILHHYNNANHYMNDVSSGKWTSSIDWTFYTHFLGELSGKSIGIYGYGKIGQCTAQVARGFGMQVYAISRGVGKDVHNDVTYLPEEQFFSECDIISLHAPLNSSNMGYIDSTKLSLMKPNSILINTARGGLINEAHLRTALEEKVIAAAYLDVLSAEPPSDNHILIGLSNCHITPHIAWATQESRKRLIRTVANNIESFQQGAPQNVVA